MVTDTATSNPEPSPGWRYYLQKNVLVQLINIKAGQWHGSKVQLQDITKSFIGEIKKLVEIVDKKVKYYFI